MNATTQPLSVFSAEKWSEAAVTGEENATQAAGRMSGNTAPLEPEVWKSMNKIK